MSQQTAQQTPQQTAQQAWFSRIGATPGKLAIIAVLAVVWVGVVVYRFRDQDDVMDGVLEGGPDGGLAKTALEASENEESSAASNVTLVKEPRANTLLLAKHSEEPPQKAPVAPKIDLQEILKHDPFAAPVALIPPSDSTTDSTIRQVAEPASQAGRSEHVNRYEQVLAMIREAEVRMILVTDADQEPVALIGDQRVQVGDEFQGLYITSISSEGVTLAERPR